MPLSSAPYSCPILGLELTCCRGRLDLQALRARGSLYGILQRPKVSQKGDSLPPCPLRHVLCTRSMALCWCQSGRLPEAELKWIPVVLKGRPRLQGSTCQEGRRRCSQDASSDKTLASADPLLSWSPEESSEKGRALRVYAQIHSFTCPVSGVVTAAEGKQLPRDLFLTLSFLRPTKAILVFYSQQRLVPGKAVSGAQEGPGVLSPKCPIRAQGCWSRSGGLVHRPQEKAQHIEFRWVRGTKTAAGSPPAASARRCHLRGGRFCYSSFAHTLTYLFREVR